MPCLEIQKCVLTGMRVRAWEGDSGSIFSTQTHGIKEKVVYVRVFSFKISIFHYMEGRSLATWVLSKLVPK